MFSLPLFLGVILSFAVLPVPAEDQITDKTVYGITLTSVVYRVIADHSKSEDVTEFVNKIFESGAKTLRLTTREAADGKAPDPVQLKEFVFTYTYAGQHKEKVFKEGFTLNFQKNLK